MVRWGGRMCWGAGSLTASDGQGALEGRLGHMQNLPSETRLAVQSTCLQEGLGL